MAFRVNGGNFNGSISEPIFQPNAAPGINHINVQPQSPNESEKTFSISKIFGAIIDLISWIFQSIFGKKTAPVIEQQIATVASIEQIHETIRVGIAKLETMGDLPQGLFRVPGLGSKINELKTFINSPQFNAEELDQKFNNASSHDIACTMKGVFDNFSLFNAQEIERLIETSRMPQDQKIEETKKFFKGLSEDRKNLLKDICVFFNGKMFEQEDKTLMTRQNLAMIWGQRFISLNQFSPAEQMILSSNITDITGIFIQHASEIFD